MMKMNLKFLLIGLLSVCMLCNTVVLPVAYAEEVLECTCNTKDGNHSDDCPLLDEEVCSCESIDGVHQEDCVLYEEPAPSEEICTCNTGDGVHQESCALYEELLSDDDLLLTSEEICTCNTGEGLHEETCNLYVMPLTDEVVDNITLSAGIYSDADRTSLDSNLTYDGAELKGWQFNEESKSSADKYLGIELSGLSMDSNVQYQLVIEMAPILYLNQNSSPSLTNTTVSFERNDSLPINTNGSYTPHEYSFKKLVYLIDSGTNSLVFGLPIRFDVNLWNKQENSVLGDGSAPLLRVYLQEKQEDGTYASFENLDVNLKQVYVDGSFPYSARTSSYLIKGTSTETSAFGPDDSIRLIFSHYAGNIHMNQYIKNMEIKITIPTCQVGDAVYSLPYKDFAYRTSSETTDYVESYDAETGILTITDENLYFTGSSTFSLVFSAPEELKNIAGNFKFIGYIEVIADGVELNKDIKLNLDTNTSPKLEPFAVSGKANIAESDTVQPLGGLAIRNTAASFNNGSGPLLIELDFDANSTNHVSVTTVNLMCDRDTEEIKIEYTLVNRDGTPAYLDSETGQNQVFKMSVKNKHYNPGETINETHYQRLTRKDLPIEAHRECFFGTLSYTMGNLPGNSWAYHTGASLAPYSAGTIWGYVNTDTIPETMPIHTMKVYQVVDNNVSETALMTKQTTTNIDLGSKVSYGIEAPSVSASSVVAGDSVTLSGRIFVPAFPYSSNSCLNNIRIGIVLPSGVTVNAASISATYTNGSKLDVESVTTRQIENSSDLLYIIEFVEGQKIGFYNESLGALETGEKLRFSIQLNSSKEMSNVTLFLHERVFVAGYKLENSSSGSYLGYAAQDRYDLNENGKITDNVACFKSGSVSVTFKTSPAELVITDEISNSNGVQGTEVNMESFADIMTYDLNIACTEGGTASDFYYIVPICKKTDTTLLETTFMDTVDVSLNLTDEVSVTTKQGTAMKVLYTINQLDSYSDALNANWIETLPSDKKWEDVTGIKVISTEDTIENGSINTISVPLKYAGQDTEYQHLAGYQIKWSSRGYYYYSIGHNSNSGMKSTDGCTITLVYTPEKPITFTLTAAKGEPTGEGASKSYSFELPVFKLAQKYSVKEIKPKNVNLMDAGYDFSGASSAEANENFRIKISVKKNTDDMGSEPIALQKENEIIGELAGNSAPKFTFTIENADALSDIVTERTVTLTLIGDNGVIVPVEITIKREMAPAEETVSAIVAGELYMPFADISTSVQVSNDSAFTAQYVTEYVQANYKDHALSFSYAPVSGTTITMIDWTDSTNVGYYYHMFNGQSSNVFLTDFFKMGSTTEKFPGFSNPNQVIEKLLFIVSFPEEGEQNRNNNTLTLTKTIKRGTDNQSSTTLAFETVNDRDFSISSNSNSVLNGEGFELNYISSCGVSDSRYAGRLLSMVVYPSSDEPIAKEARLVVDGTYYSLNAQGAFIVPLQPVQKGDGSVTASFHSSSLSDVKLNVELWASATSNGSKSWMGEMVTSIPKESPIVVSPITKPSFKITGMSDRLIETDELGETVTVNFDKKNDSSITIELQMKIGADYVTQTAILESVNGNTVADAGQGKFKITDSSAKLKLSKITSAGTYRLLFTVSNGNSTIKVPYNFVIVE